jgi:hypothetical protein
MATTSLPAPKSTARRRAFFGLFDADGWTWAGAKAVFWFVLIIAMLGYLPDRAYYFTVGQTVDIWPLAPFLQWAPINLCPPENETLPCPAPTGASLPWHPAPPELQLPGGAARALGAGGVIGSTYLYAGGTDGHAPTATTFVSHSVPTGNLDKWSAGPALPEARSDAAYTVLGNTLYVIGGYGPDGKPTSTVYSLAVASDGTLGTWKTEDKLALPAPRAGSSAIAVSDGIVLFGGTDGNAATRSVWKTQQANNAFTAWTDQAPLAEANMDGFAAHVADLAWVVGGRNDKGQVVATVQQGNIGGGPKAKATPTDPNQIEAWRYSAQTNLPGPRAQLGGFVSNGQVYVVGGTDGVIPRTEMLWAIPDASGAFSSWSHLPQTDLGQGNQGLVGIVSGAYAFMIGGQTPGGVTGDSARAYLAPKLPFFSLGVLGATVPALSLSGDIGQQIGYLNAAGVGTVNFVLLLLVGWGFAHKEKVRAMIPRRRKE